MIQQQKVDNRNSAKSRVYCQMLW